MLQVVIKHRGPSDPMVILHIKDEQLSFVENGQDILEYDIQSVHTVHDTDGHPVPFRLSYRQWMRRSRQLCYKIAGCGLSDAGDYDALSSYEGGMTPLQFVAEHLQSACFPFPPQFDPDGDEAEQLLVLATFHG